MHLKAMVPYAALAVASLVGGAILSYGFSTMAAISGYPVGQMYQAGITNFWGKESNYGWPNNSYTCDAGYGLQMYHYDSGSSNNATWYACE